VFVVTVGFADVVTPRAASELVLVMPESCPAAVTAAAGEAVLMTAVTVES